MAQPFSYMSKATGSGVQNAAQRAASIAKWRGTTAPDDDEQAKKQVPARPTTTPARTATPAYSPTTINRRTTAPVEPDMEVIRAATAQNAPVMYANNTTPPANTAPAGQRNPLDWSNFGPNPATWRGKGKFDITKLQGDIAADTQWRKSIPQATRGQSIEMAMRYLDPQWSAPTWLNRLMEGEAQSATVPGYAYGLRPEYIDALLRTYKTKAVPGTPDAQKYKEVENFLRAATNANFQGSSPTVPGGMLNGWPEWLLRAQSQPTTPTPPTTPGTPTMQPIAPTPPVQTYPSPNTTTPNQTGTGASNTAIPQVGQAPLYNVYIPGVGGQPATAAPTTAPVNVNQLSAAELARLRAGFPQYGNQNQPIPGLNGWQPPTTPGTAPAPTYAPSPNTTTPGQTGTGASNTNLQLPPAMQYLQQNGILPRPTSPEGAGANPLAMVNPLGQMFSTGVGATGYPFPWYGGSGSGTSPVPNPQPVGGTTMPTADEIAAGNKVGDYLTYMFGSKPSWFNDPNWAANPTTRATVQAWVAAMQPYMQTYQNAYQYGQDFNEAQRRWDAEQGWQQQMDAYNASLTGRQQTMAEWQAQEAARQAQQTFGYQQERDKNEMDLARWQTNQQVWGRNVAPNVNFIRSGGWA